MAANMAETVKNVVSQLQHTPILVIYQLKNITTWRPVQPRKFYWHIVNCCNPKGNLDGNKLLILTTWVSGSGIQLRQHITNVISEEQNGR